MANKKQSKRPPEPHFLKLLSITLGFFLCISLALNFFLFFSIPSYQQTQELKAFKGIADSYLYETFFSEENDIIQTAMPGDLGVTDDNDLYIDFTLIKSESTTHSLLSFRKARLHFQCAQTSVSDDSCARAFWYGDWEDTSEEFRAASRKFYIESEALTEAINSTEDETEIKRLRDEYDVLYQSYMNDYYLPLTSTFSNS